MPDAVLLLHGIAHTSASVRPLQRTLERDGHAVLNLDHRSRHLPLDAQAEGHPSAGVALRDRGAQRPPRRGTLDGWPLARVHPARHRPARLGRVVKPGTPSGGSELADALRAWPPYRAIFGPAGQQLATVQAPELRAAFGTVDYPLGVPAGDRPLIALAAAMFIPGPSDGEISVASTRLAGMAEHHVVHASHMHLASHPATVAAALRFLRHGTFGAGP